ncbi:MAG: alpha-1,3-galactosidase B, partial [Lentisphaeria bacterium]
MQEKIIGFEAFGVGPDTGGDATAAWNRLLEQLDAEPHDGPVTIVFQPGRYDFYAEHAAEREYYVSNHTQTARKKCGILLENRRGVTLDGGGAEFIFHGTLIPVAVVDATDCTLKNFSIDYRYPPVHQLRVRSADPARKCVVAEVCSDEAYRIENGRDLRFTAEDNAGYRLESSIFFAADGRMVYNLPDQPFNPEKITELAPRLLEIAGWRDDLAEGVRFVLRVAPRPTPGLFLYHADRARIDNVTVHFAFGMGLLAQLTEDVSLNGFRVCRRGADDPRFFTTHADATHFSGCKGMIRSENGLYEGMNDDAI